MIDRFKGDDGYHRLVAAICAQSLIQNNGEVAKLLADVADRKFFGPGDYLIRQGGSDSDIHFLLSGKVEVLVNGRVIATRQKNQHVGEMAMIGAGAPRCACIRAVEPTVSAIVREEMFTPIARTYPDLWRQLAKEACDRLRQRNSLVRARNAKPIVFIGSSTEKLDVAREIQVGLDHDELHAQVWTDGAFKISDTNIEAIEKLGEQIDFAVMVEGPDDKVISRGSAAMASRDNVSGEIFFFMGKLERRRTVIVRPRGTKLKIPSDLQGVIALDYSTDAGQDLTQRIGPVCTAIRKHVKQYGPR